jgi:glutamate synthase (NADPH/NADH) small chain
MKLSSAPAASAMRAIVIGGGNTAIDAARELSKLGVSEVSLVYRRTAPEMPGYAHELELARKEGVRFVERAVPQAFARDAGGALTGLELADGRKIACDLAVVAIGQSKLREFAAQFEGLVLDDRGRVLVDEHSGRTGHAKVWAGGDVLGGELVVTAAQEAKRAARSMCATLGVKVRSDAAMTKGHA